MLGRYANLHLNEDVLDVIQDTETHANIIGIPYIYDKPENQQR